MYGVRSDDRPQNRRLPDAEPRGRGRRYVKLGRFNQTRVLQVNASTGEEANCLLCGGCARPYIRARGLLADAKSYRVFRCDACDFGFVWPRPSASELNAYYHAYHTGTGFDTGPKPTSHGLRKLESWARGRTSWQFDRSSNIVEHLIELTGGDLSGLCDVGCGNGNLLLQLAGRGLSGIGVEPSPEARSQAAERGLQVFEGTAEDLPSDLPNNLRLIVMSHVLEHTTQPQLAVEQCKAHLREGGSVVIEVPNNGCFSAQRAMSTWRWLDVPRHLNFFTRRSLTLLLTRCGLEIAQFKYRGFCRVFSDGWIAAEQSAFDRIRQISPEEIKGVRRNGRFRAWMLLMRCIMTSNPDRSYDSVRVVACKRSGS